MAVGNEQRRNLRPYILIFCFIWGLLLGFFSYIYMKTAAQRLEIIEVEENKEKEKTKEKLQQEEIPVAQIAPFKKTEEVEKPPEVAEILTKPEVTLLDEKIIAPNFREPPVIPSPSLEALPGLTGATVRKPLRPREPVMELIVEPSASQSPVSRKKQSPFADESVVFEDIAPPELDD